MLKVVIVDDEPTIASGIAYLIKRNNSDICQVVGVANDGMEGYRMAIEMQPDIMLTDICMADCDGLEMISRLQSRNAVTSFVVISGYAEFGYAKRAMQLGVTDFLTKPVDEKELRATLLELHDQIGVIKEKNAKYESAQKILLDLDVKNFLRRSKEVDHERLKAELTQRGFPTDSGDFICALLYVKDMAASSAEMLLKSRFQDAYVVACSVDTVAVLVSTPAVYCSEEIIHEIEYKMRSLVLSAKISVCCGIGVPVGSFPELPKSYEMAELVLNYRILQEDFCVNSYKNIEEIPWETDWIAEEELNKLEDAIDQRREDVCEEALRRIFEMVRKNRDLGHAELRRIYLKLMLFGLRRQLDAQLQLNRYFGRNIFTLKNMEEFNSAYKLENWLVNILRIMCQLTTNVGAAEKQDIVSEAKTYIRQNFNKNISLSDISEKFYINPYYLASCLKRKPA